MSVGVSAKIREAILNSVKDLPPLPEAVSRIIEETNKEGVRTEIIESILSSDAAIASKTLKVVNSAYYGLPRQVTSLNQAVVILGIQQIRNLALSLGTVNTIKASGGSQSLKQFWVRAFATAAGAREIILRKRGGPAVQELAFVGGLLHDIGSLYLAAEFSSMYQQVTKKAESSNLVEAELEVLGLDHTEVGALIAESWQFPAELIEVIATHEGPFSAQSSPVAMAVKIADQVAQMFVSGPPSGPSDEFAREWINFDEALEAEFAATMGAKLEAAAEMLGVLM